MKKEMEDFERRFAELMRGSVLPMDAVLRYVGAVPGKRLRPQLVFLTAKLFGEVNESTCRTALFVELLHTATLIHDDVVDTSDTRRGQPSVNAQWDNKTAVLAGDYLLAKAMRLLSNPEDRLILNEMLDVAMSMSEGELMQNGERNGEALNEAKRVKTENGELYLDIITLKTARLIQACCVGGALSVTGEKMKLVGDFGIDFGLLFQMRDDILDHDNPETTALAERLLPEYLKKTISDLDALAPYAVHQEALVSLREWTVFCATRNH